MQTVTLPVIESLNSFKKCHTGLGLTLQFLFSQIKDNRSDLQKINEQYESYFYAFQETLKKELDFLDEVRLNIFQAPTKEVVKAYRHFLKREIDSINQASKLETQLICIFLESNGCTVDFDSDTVETVPLPIYKRSELMSGLGYALLSFIKIGESVATELIEEFAAKISDLDNDETESEIIETNQKKMKWLGSPAQFGLIIDHLVQGGYLEKPTGSFTKDAGFYLNYFEIDTTKDTLAKELSETTNSVAPHNRRQFIIPQKDKLK